MLFCPEIKSVKRRYTVIAGDMSLSHHADPALEMAPSDGNAEAVGKGGEFDDSYQSLNKQGLLLMAIGDLSAAESFMLKALAKMKVVLGELHMHTLHTMCTVALLLQARGQLGAAERMLAEAVAGKRRRLREGHPDTLQAVSNLAALVYARGDIAAAEPLFREVSILN